MKNKPNREAIFATTPHPVLAGQTMQVPLNRLAARTLESQSRGYAGKIRARDVRTHQRKFGFDRKRLVAASTSVPMSTFVEPTWV